MIFYMTVQFINLDYNKIQVAYKQKTGACGVSLLLKVSYCIHQHVCSYHRAISACILG